jgi:YD repeat-containing protein
MGWLLAALASPAWAGSAAYTYDTLGRLTQVTYAGGVAIDYAYDAAGNRSSSTVSTALSTLDTATPTLAAFAATPPSEGPMAPPTGLQGPGEPAEALVFNAKDLGSGVGPFGQSPSAGTWGFPQALALPPTALAIEPSRNVLSGEGRAVRVDGWL